MIGVLVAACVAALLTIAVTPLVLRWAEMRGVVDVPDERRINQDPRPRLGGIAIFLGFVCAVILTIGVRQARLPNQLIWTPQVTGILLATAFIALAGLVDDFQNLAARWQALAILAASLILVAFGVRIEGVTNPFGGSIGASYNPGVNWLSLGTLASVLLTILWVFTVTKTVDAIDGLDGLAAGVCAISAATLTLMSAQLRTVEGPTLALMAAAVMGACLGFLRYNYNPAKIFMGTVGAQTLGLVLAAISILGAFKIAAAVSVLVPLLVLGVPIFDYAHVLTRRILDRAPLTAADKRHLHHRLLALGWNQRQVAWFIYGVTAALCTVAFLLFRVGRPS
jgi:UDP-GlcNAc:undecaprenyl-phosphate GlcNAc-1-phosphate transferase